MQHKSYYLTAILLGLGLTGLLAQEAISSSGGNFTGDGGTVCYTIGQVAYTINSGASGSVLQGVQQPYEISEYTGLPEFPHHGLELSVFPNPATDHLILEVKSEVLHGLQSIRYRLFDGYGRKLKEEKITGFQTSIDMENLAPGLYFLRLYAESGQQEVKTFKIIKN